LIQEACYLIVGILRVMHKTFVAILQIFAIYTLCLTLINFCSNLPVEDFLVTRMQVDVFIKFIH